MLATQEGCTAQHFWNKLLSPGPGGLCVAEPGEGAGQWGGGESQSIGVGRGGVFTTERVNSSVSFLKCSNNFSVQKKKKNTKHRLETWHR